MIKDKLNIRNLSQEQITLAVNEAKFPSFRAKQIYEWLWKKNALSFDEMRNLGKDLLEHLNQHYYIDALRVKDQQISKDKTIKSAFEIDEKRIVEGVLIPTTSRTTACISSQIGCSLSCTFCATGSLKLMRNLSAGEMVDQVVYLRNQALEKYQIQLDDRSLIKIFPIINKLDPFILKRVDWVFFSSKNAIECFFSLSPQMPKKVKYGVIGRASEEMLRRYGIVPDFNGEEDGIDTQDIAKDFAKLANGSTVLFPGAKDSLRTIQQALNKATKIIDLPVYETEMDENCDPSAAEVLVFTSPSNVDAYFTNNLLEPGQQVICIGKSTGKKFDQMNVTYTLPYSPDEIGLAEAVFGLTY
mgnify:CR=1 FL=1